MVALFERATDRQIIIKVVAQTGDEKILMDEYRRAVGDKAHVVSESGENPGLVFYPKQPP